MQKIESYDFGENSFRMVIIDNEPYFCGADLSHYLQYKSKMTYPSYLKTCRLDGKSRGTYIAITSIEDAFGKTTGIRAIKARELINSLKSNFPDWFETQALKGQHLVDRHTSYETQLTIIKIKREALDKQEDILKLRKDLEILENRIAEMSSTSVKITHLKRVNSDADDS